MDIFKRVVKYFDADIFKANVIGDLTSFANRETSHIKSKFRRAESMDSVIRYIKLNLGGDGIVDLYSCPIYYREVLLNFISEKPLYEKVYQDNDEILTMVPNAGDDFDQYRQERLTNPLYALDADMGREFHYDVKSK